MSVLEWIGVVAVVYCIGAWLLGAYKSKYPEKFSKDPSYSRRQAEFDRMTKALIKLENLRDSSCDPHNEIITNVQMALEDVVQATVPLPRNAFASDYRSKYVDYSVIIYLAKNIINSELKSVKPAQKELRIEWS